MNNSRTALISACSNECEEVIEALLNKNDVYTKKKYRNKTWIW